MASRRLCSRRVALAEVEWLLSPSPSPGGLRLRQATPAPAAAAGPQEQATGQGFVDFAPCAAWPAAAGAGRRRRAAAIGPLSNLLWSLAEGAADPEAAEKERVARARKLLEEAIARSRPEPAAAAGAAMAKVGLRVDKYFGTKLPPVCARLGCYVTDDGKRFYCVNPACQKHKKRETKHTRRGNPAKEHFVYFKCPRCQSRSVEMNLLSNKYACKTCKYVWEK